MLVVSVSKTNCFCFMSSSANALMSASVSTNLYSCCTVLAESLSEKVSKSPVSFPWWNKSNCPEEDGASVENRSGCEGFEIDLGAEVSIMGRPSWVFL